MFKALAVIIESGIAYTLLWVRLLVYALVMMLIACQIWYVVGSNNSITGTKTAAWTNFYFVPLTVSARQPIQRSLSDPSMTF